MKHKNYEYYKQKPEQVDFFRVASETYHILFQNDTENKVDKSLIKNEASQV